MKSFSKLAAVLALALAFVLASCANGDNGDSLYSLTFEGKIKNGSVKASKETGIEEGETIILTAMPNEGYMLDRLSVKCDGKEVALKDNSFVMPAGDVVISVEFVVFNYSFTDTVQEAGSVTVNGKDYELVYFGDFPQSQKAENVVIFQSKSYERGDYTYYQGSDGFYYCYTKAMEGDSAKYYKVEPVLWRVLTDDYNGKKLLLSERILVNCKYYDYSKVSRGTEESPVYPNNYKESRVRAYLNGLSYSKKASEESEMVTESLFNGKGFLNTAFSAAAKNLIAETDVDNSVSSADSYEKNANPREEFACADTKDKIFLLSLREVTNPDYGFDSFEDSRLAEANGSSRLKKAVDFTGSSAGSWWLRSPYNENNIGDARFVSHMGNSAEATFVDANSMGLAPALCLE